MGNIDPEHHIFYKEVHGLDKSWYIQYGFLKGFFTGNQSYISEALFDLHNDFVREKD
jgi:hypothetical protein